MSALRGRAESRKHLEGLQAALAISGRAQRRENSAQQASLGLSGGRRQRHQCGFNASAFTDLKDHSQHGWKTEDPTPGSGVCT